MNKVREFLRGRKSYIMAAIGLAAAVVAWSENEISGTSLLAAAWAAIQTCFIRAGISNAIAKSQE